MQARAAAVETVGGRHSPWGGCTADGFSVACMRAGASSWALLGRGRAGVRALCMLACWRAHARGAGQARRAIIPAVCQGGVPGQKRRPQSMERRHHRRAITRGPGSAPGNEPGRLQARLVMEECRMAREEWGRGGRTSRGVLGQAQQPSPLWARHPAHPHPRRSLCSAQQQPACSPPAPREPSHPNGQLQRSPAPRGSHTHHPCTAPRPDHGRRCRAPDRRRPCGPARAAAAAARGCGAPQGGARRACS